MPNHSKKPKRWLTCDFDGSCNLDLLRLTVVDLVSSVRANIKAHATDTKCRCLFQLAQIFVALVGIISNFPWVRFPKWLTCKRLRRANVNAFVTITTAVFHRFFGGLQRCIGKDATPSHSWTYIRGHKKTAFANPTKPCITCGHFMGKNTIKLFIVNKPLELPVSAVNGCLPFESHCLTVKRYDRGAD